MRTHSLHKLLATFYGVATDIRVSLAGEGTGRLPRKAKSEVWLTEYVRPTLDIKQAGMQVDCFHQMFIDAGRQRKLWPSTRLQQRRGVRQVTNLVVLVVSGARRSSGTYTLTS